MTRNKTADGWELAVEQDVSVAVFRAECLELRPQPNVADTDPAAWDGLLEAARKLPPPRAAPTPPKGQAGPQLVIEDDSNEVVEPVDPQRAALQELVERLSRGTDMVSLLAWKAGRRELADVSDEAWLMFACIQLKGSGFPVRFVETRSTEPFPINELFHDIEAWSPVAEAA